MYMSLNTAPVTVQGIGGNVAPPEGNKTIGPTYVNFATVNPFIDNLSLGMQQSSLISFAKSVYIDNAKNPNVTTFTVLGPGGSTGQIVVAKGYTQGWYSISMGRPINYQIQSAANTGITGLTFANYQEVASVWATQ